MFCWTGLFCPHLGDLGFHFLPQMNFKQMTLCLLSQARREMTTVWMGNKKKNIHSIHEIKHLFFVKFVRFCILRGGSLAILWDILDLCSIPSILFLNGNQFNEVDWILSFTMCPRVCAQPDNHASLKIPVSFLALENKQIARQTEAPGTAIIHV